MKDPELNKFFNVAFSVSVALYAFMDGEQKVFIVKNDEMPFKGAMKLPGNLVDPSVSLQDACDDILEEYIGNKDVYAEQLNAFGKVYRHPTGRVIEIAFYALINIENDLKKNLMDLDSKWVSIENVPELAFDHNEILEFSRLRLKRRLTNRPIGKELMPEKFTMNELQRLYESILNRRMDKRNFRRKIMKMDILIEDKKVQTNKTGRKSKLYKFDPEKYKNYSVTGF